MRSRKYQLWDSVWHEATGLRWNRPSKRLDVWHSVHTGGRNHHHLALNFNQHILCHCTFSCSIFCSTTYWCQSVLLLEIIFWSTPDANQENYQTCHYCHWIKICSKRWWGNNFLPKTFPPSRLNNMCTGIQCFLSTNIGGRLLQDVAEDLLRNAGDNFFLGVAAVTNLLLINILNNCWRCSNFDYKGLHEYACIFGPRNEWNYEGKCVQILCTRKTHSVWCGKHRKWLQGPPIIIRANNKCLCALAFAELSSSAII